MALKDLFEPLQASPLGRLVAQSAWLFPTLETIHVLALAIVVGTILIVDLRLLGLASKERTVTGITKEYLPLTWGAFAVAVVTGLLLFSSRAADYIVIQAFTLKFVFMGLAGLNMLIFHFSTYRTVSSWDAGAPVAGARIAGGLSLLFWGVVIIFGRQIGFLL